jgi:hypothetical protein
MKFIFDAGQIFFTYNEKSKVKLTNVTIDDMVRFVDSIGQTKSAICLFCVDGSDGYSIWIGLEEESKNCAGMNIGFCTDGHFAEMDLTFSKEEFITAVTDFIKQQS